MTILATRAFSQNSVCPLHERKAFVLRGAEAAQRLQSGDRLRDCRMASGEDRQLLV